MSKVRFDLKKIATPESIRVAGKVLQSIDTIIHLEVAGMLNVDLFSRGKEQGFCLHLKDWDESIDLRIAFAQEYNSNWIVVYFAPVAKMGDFMRGITEFLNGRESEVQAEYFPEGTFLETAEFIVKILDDVEEN